MITRMMIMVMMMIIITIIIIIIIIAMITGKIFAVKSNLYYYFHTDPALASFSTSVITNQTTYTYHEGTAVAQWLRCCATNRKVAGSIPASVIGFFIDIKFFRSHYGPGVDSASNRNEYQEHFLRVKAAGA